MLAEFSDRDDRPAYVQFEMRPVEDPAASKKEGRWIGQDVEYVLVTPPNSRDCFEFKADQWFKNQRENVRNNRTPESWLKYWENCRSAWQNDLEEPLNGNDIRNWSMLSPAQQKSVRAAGCRTIEDLAASNEDTLKRIGIGAVDLRNKARAFLQTSKDTGPIIAENAALKNQVLQLEGSIESLQAQIDKLVSKSNEEASKQVSETMPEPVGGDGELTLEQQYVQKFGKRPHHKKSDETIRQELQL